MRAAYPLLAVALTLSACAANTPADYQSSAFTRANYMAIDTLMQSLSSVHTNSSLLVATVSDIDRLQQSSRLGRLITEQISTRLTQTGYPVAELRLRESVAMHEGEGEFVLSRDVRALSKQHQAQLVIVGQYAAASTHIYLTLKAISPSDNRVVAATNYLLPLNENTRALLAP